MKKNLFTCVIIVLLTGYMSHAQNTIAFEYDDNGNRVNRHVVTLKSFESSDSAAQSGASVVMGETIIHVYPNPTTGEIYIETSEDADELNFTLTDYTGRIVYRGLSIEKKTHIDLSEENSGQYLLLVREGSKEEVFVIIKQ